MIIEKKKNFATILFSGAAIGWLFYWLKDIYFAKYFDNQFIV